MAAWSEILLSETFPRLNLAGDHYHPAKLLALKELRKNSTQTISQLAVNIKELAEPANENPIFDLGSALNQILSIDDAQSNDRVSAKKIAKGQDVIVSRLRTYLRQIAYIPKDIKEINVSTEFIVLRGEDISFLVPFLLSGRVQTILQWSQDGNTHPRISPEVLTNLFVPDRVLKHKLELNELMSEAELLLKIAKQCVSEAEDILDKSLSLSSVARQKNTFAEVNFSNTCLERRFDAEFFQPKYQAVMTKLRRGGARLSSVCSLIKTPFKPIAGKSFKYIEIGDLRNDYGFNHLELDGSEAPSRAEFIVQNGDVLTSTVRPIRRLTGIVDDSTDGAVCSSGYAVLRPHSISSELLCTYLRLVPITEILDLYTTASMYPAISTDNLMQIPFLYPGKFAEEQITKKIHQARAARDTCRILINNAINRVEQLIAEEI